MSRAKHSPLAVYLTSVVADRKRTRTEWGDDYENSKSVSMFIALAASELGKLADANLQTRDAECEFDERYTEALQTMQVQSVIIGGLMASLYELAEKSLEEIHRQIDEDAHNDLLYG